MCSRASHGPTRFPIVLHCFLWPSCATPGKLKTNKFIDDCHRFSHEFSTRFVSNNLCQHFLLFFFCSLQLPRCGQGFNAATESVQKCGVAVDEDGHRQRFWLSSLQMHIGRGTWPLGVDLHRGTCHGPLFWWQHFGDNMFLTLWTFGPHGKDILGGISAHGGNRCHPCASPPTPLCDGRVRRWPTFGDPACREPQSEAPHVCRAA